MKNKINQDTIAMILADFQHGEITECTCDCNDCPLNKEVPVGLGINQKVTICNIMCDMSELLEEKENDN